MRGGKVLGYSQTGRTPRDAFAFHAITGNRQPFKCLARCPQLPRSGPTVYLLYCKKIPPTPLFVNGDTPLLGRKGFCAKEIAGQSRGRCNRPAIHQPRKEQPNVLPCVYKHVCLCASVWWVYADCVASNPPWYQKYIKKWGTPYPFLAHFPNLTKSILFLMRCSVLEQSENACVLYCGRGWNICVEQSENACGCGRATRRANPTA